MAETATGRDDANGDGTDAAPASTGVVASAVAAARRVPLILHVLALALVLLAALPWIDTGNVGMADEGAGLIQAQIVQRTGEWGTASPTQALDPEGRWFPVPLSERIDDQWFPYTKHTIYPQLLARTLDLGGYRLVLALHVLGVVLAAWAGAALARRAAPRHVRLTLWTLGLGSPLFFDGYWAIAHSLACAAAALAVLGVLRAREGHRLDGTLCLVVGLALTGALRSEGTLFGLALAVGVVACGWRVARRGALLLGAVAGATTVVTYMGSAELERLAMGSDTATPFRIEDMRQGFLEGRVTGVWHSLLIPQLGGQQSGFAVCLFGALACAVAWWAARTRPTETVIISTAAVIAAVAWMLRVGMPLRPLPGLFVVSPVVLAGAISWRRRQRTPTRDLLLVTVLLYSLAVIATQYGTGGSGDWGGRYFRLALPLFVPLALVAIGDTLRTVTPRTRQMLVGSLVTSCICLTLLAAMTQQRMHEVTSLRVAATAAAADTLASAAEPGGAVVVSTRDEFGRFAWDQVLDHRYLGVSAAEELTDVVAALDAAEVPDLVFAGPPDEVGPRLATLTEGGYEVVSRRSVPTTGWDVVVAVRRP